MTKRRSGMTTKAYCDALEKLNLSQVAGGAMLGLSPRQAQRVAAGESPVPLPVAKLLKLILRLKMKPADVD